MYKTTGLTHLINSTKYSLQGLKSAFKNETAFRHECFLACILIPLTFFLGETKIEIILMISSGRVKDQGSASVFIALCIVGIVWGGILFF